MTLSAIFAEWFGVQPCAGRVIATLYRANGGRVSHDLLMLHSGQTYNGLRLSIKNLRKAMEPGSILTGYSFGYRLSKTGLADCERALADAKQRGVAA